MTSAAAKPERTDWQDRGEGPMTDAQRRLLNAACGDLALQVRWHGVVLTKDDWRHVISGTILGDRLIPGINTGEGYPGLIRLPRSSLELSRTNATKAIRTAFDVGDNPEDQGLDCAPVRWCQVVCLARFVAEDA